MIALVDTVRDFADLLSRNELPPQVNIILSLYFFAYSAAFISRRLRVCVTELSKEPMLCLYSKIAILVRTAGKRFAGALAYDHAFAVVANRSLLYVTFPTDLVIGLYLLLMGLILAILIVLAVFRHVSVADYVLFKGCLLAGLHLLLARKCFVDARRTWLRIRNEEPSSP